MGGDDVVLGIHVKIFNCNNPKITDCFPPLGHHKIEHFQLDNKSWRPFSAAKVDVS
jgi:hypothetical protein